MKKILIFFVFVLSTFLFSNFSFASEKNNSPVLLTIMKGNSTEYLRTLFKFYKVKNLIYQSYFSTGGITYILRNYNNLSTYLVRIEADGLKEIENKGKKFCSEYPFYILDHCETNVNFFGSDVVNVLVSCNIVCLELN